jgi:pimeloyl-ACP methyl ester carboxylesterase
MGARVALEIWRRSPGRISRLALVDTGTHEVRIGEREARYALRDAGRAFGIEKLIDSWLPPMVAPQKRGDKALMHQLSAMVREAGQATFERQIGALLSRPPVSGVLQTITCPTFVVVGECDEWSPVAQHVAIAAEIQNAELRIIPSAGHMAPAECPEGFVKIVHEWLAWEPPSPR